MGARQQRRCAERVKLGGLLGLLLCGAPAAQEAGDPADSWTAEIDRRLTGLTFLLACADPACEGCDRRMGQVCVPQPSHPLILTSTFTTADSESLTH